MTSELALAEIESLEERGLRPTPRDIVRLNSLALKLEAAKKKSAACSLDYLPRVAAISKEITFRQPTIGHDIWMDRVEQLIDATDFQTVLAVKAFALSRDAKDLPPVESAAAIEEAVKAYLPTLSDFTREQIFAAIDYVMFGASPLLGEHAPNTADDETPTDLTDGECWKRCVALGVLHEGQVALWGMSRSEMERMTREQLQDQISRAYIFHQIFSSGEERRAQGDFYSALNEIEERLKKEKEDGGK